MTGEEFHAGLALERRSQAHRRRVGLEPTGEEEGRRYVALLLIDHCWAARDREAAAGRETGDG